MLRGRQLLTAAPDQTPSPPGVRGVSNGGRCPRPRHRPCDEMGRHPLSPRPSGDRKLKSMTAKLLGEQAEGASGRVSAYWTSLGQGEGRPLGHKTAPVPAGSHITDVLVRGTHRPLPASACLTAPCSSGVRQPPPTCPKLAWGPRLGRCLLWAPRGPCTSGSHRGGLPAYVALMFTGGTYSSPCTQHQCGAQRGAGSEGPSSASQ